MLSSVTCPIVICVDLLLSGPAAFGECHRSGLARVAGGGGPSSSRNGNVRHVPGDFSLSFDILEAVYPSTVFCTIIKSTSNHIQMYDA